MRNKAKWVSLIVTGFLFLSVLVFPVQAVDHGEIQAGDLDAKPEAGYVLPAFPEASGDAGEIQASDLETTVDPGLRSVAGLEKDADHGEIQGSDLSAN